MCLFIDLFRIDLTVLRTLYTTMQKFLLSGCRHRVIATTTPISGRTGFPLKGRLSCLGINNARRCYSGGVRYSSRKGIVAGSVVPLGMGTRCAGVRMQERSYATSSSSGKTEADEMVEELQDLFVPFSPLFSTHLTTQTRYEIAKDEVHTPFPLPSLKPTQP